MDFPACHGRLTSGSSGTAFLFPDMRFFIMKHHWAETAKIFLGDSTWQFSSQPGKRSRLAS